MYKDLEGKTAVITGGDSGIGAAIAARLGEEHMNVVINYHKNVDSANETKAIVEKNGGKAVIEQGDISDEASANRLVQTAVDSFGGLDVFYNNAGLEKKCPTDQVTLDQWNAVISVNLTGTFLGTKAALDYWIANNKKGVIVNTSSVHQQIPWPTFASYASSKGGVKLFSETTAMEYAKKNIRINQICPGAINTPINAKKFSDPKTYEETVSMVPMGRIGKPSEVAAGAAWLASDQASYVTGISLYIDGGMTLYPSFQNGNG
ncbi:sugar dehydrogenase [Fructilactobacillus lindneri]|uniref:Glucose-1-dehydrogenase n=2 Tax=Fructilactobacillus lindneri TaxID=53444 RepID=A0A0R2JSJ4_9LACO|nr:glucose 1-dehydrogenase [Fructilactobacillus lindneri]ANZ58516.1 sugar dehydrogenase [Fructilactobacillus lindneri]ANZ59825.1 sugar dehydrogenase [Fructilactobacillus lindneri]KRN78822.1 glucose-1-dehydrogenase [Fructilactobacillus lindneri DSM 20690 = JCM 11027]POG98049.1 sugar dehydrogenase [Fructilactobacillus lindneri]POG99106.1 sugar dehydrogenase [Fructilactobacillus lindneri]